ncbi:MAG: MarR family winged helix-turn-helix transcriptional regulator [Parcubacteria group bacterium]|jgi:DNA-binding MarR family transcriptional regulator
MKQIINPSVKFFIDLAKVQAISSRRFDNSLGGLGFNEFIILYHLSQAENEKMRRIDLADKIGLTASGVTRILLPMEKVGLIKKEVNKDDARSSLVIIASGGKRRLLEGLERSELLVEEIISSKNKSKIKQSLKFLTELSKDIR